MVASLARARSSVCPLRRVKAMLPSAMVPPPCSISRMIDREVTDLPEPDSPTMASTSPARTWKLRFLTATTLLSDVSKRTVRPSTSKTFVSFTRFFSRSPALRRFPADAVARNDVQRPADPAAPSGAGAQAAAQSPPPAGIGFTLIKAKRYALSIPARHPPSGPPAFSTSTTRKSMEKMSTFFLPPLVPRGGGRP